MRPEDIPTSLPVKQRLKYHAEKKLWICETTITNFYNEKYMDIVKSEGEKKAQEKTQDSTA